MKVYVLLYLRTVGDWMDPIKVKEFEAIFETREAADAARMKLSINPVKSLYVVEEYEVKQ